MAHTTVRRPETKEYEWNVFSYRRLPFSLFRDTIQGPQANQASQVRGINCVPCLLRIPKARQVCTAYLLLPRIQRTRVFYLPKCGGRRDGGGGENQVFLYASLEVWIYFRRAASDVFRSSSAETHTKNTDGVEGRNCRMQRGICHMKQFRKKRNRDMKYFEEIETSLQSTLRCFPFVPPQQLFELGKNKEVGVGVSLEEKKSEVLNYI